MGVQGAKWGVGWGEALERSLGSSVMWRCLVWTREPSRATGICHLMPGEGACDRGLGP